jgi:hypothetical protein
MNESAAPRSRMDLQCTADALAFQRRFGSHPGVFR